MHMHKLSKFFKSVCSPAIILVSIIFLTELNPNIANAQEVLCAKKQAKLNKRGRINLAKSLSLAESCPKGFKSLGSVAGPRVFERVFRLDVPSNCFAASYNGLTPQTLCSTAPFEKLADDTLLEVTFHGRIKRPDGMVGNSMIYRVTLDGVEAEGNAGRMIVRKDDSLGNSDDSIHSSTQAIFNGFIAGSYPITFTASGQNLANSGNTPMIDPGNYGSSLLIIREFLPALTSSP